MCFTQRITGGMFALCFGTAAVLTRRGRPWRQTQLFYVFAAMELLQYLQHMVVDDCSSRLNFWTTLLSYAHICFQPLSICVYAFRTEPNRDVAKFVQLSAAFAGVLALLRVPYLGIGFLPASLRAILPGLPDPSLAGSACDWEWCCGPRTCTTTGKLHLAWEVPLLPPSYFLPSGTFHFLFIFGPLLLAPGQFTKHRRAMAALLLATGPFVAQAATYAANDGDPRWQLEWAGVWCLFSAAQCVIALAYEYFNHISEENFAPGTPQYDDYISKVRAGKLWSLRPADWAAAGGGGGGSGTNGVMNGKKAE
ncbi:MAG: hypothetical protein J3K34DRAFT_426270 [Monoraphidium minutum]|nr:MAG: hypothetical protein J3K34DRAFT_426270 [Monoraphidium minutum]